MLLISSFIFYLVLSKYLSLYSITDKQATNTL